MAAQTPDDWRAQRSELIDRLASLPQAMRELPQWLLYKLEQKPGQAKPAKVPYYASGHRRVGKQGDDADRHALVSFDAALKRLGQAREFAGLGFAFLPGDGLVGIDIDGAIDPESGEISAMCRELIDGCASYTERSPSGKGVHIITAGTIAKSFKSNEIGLEVFCSAQFFTCTGAWWPGAPREVRPLGDAVLVRMRELVEQGKAHARAVPAPSLPAPSGGATHSDLVAWLEQALQVLDPACGYFEWIGIGMALKSALGDAGFALWDYWSSKAGERYGGAAKLAVHWKSFPGTDADGALTIFKMARKGKRWQPPREYLAVHGSDAERARIAKTDRPALRLVSAPDDVSDEAETDRAIGQPSGADARPEPPPPELPEGESQPRGGRRRKRPPVEAGGGGIGARLLENFALLYGTDQVWDGERRVLILVKNMRLLFGAPHVNDWLAHPERKLLYPEQMVFEPGAELPEGHVNLFDGFAMEPVECTEADVAPMIELGRHLCSLSARTPEGCEKVWQQLLCWLALPLQQPGAKLRFACVFHGPQGTGKNLFFDGVRAIYGKYGRMVGQTELDDKFNGYMSGKLMLIGNEVVTRQELFHNKNKLKWVITEDEIPIRGMHQEVRWERNHANLVFLSNEMQPVALEKDDRRHLVVYTPGAQDRDLYLRVAAFLKQGGAAKFMDYLLHGVDTSGFDEHTFPLMTEAKEELIELGLKPAERFANEWLDGYLPLPLQVCSAEQLYRVFRRWADLNGERWPPPQAQFTQTVKRHVYERVQRYPAGHAEAGERMPPRLTYKVVALQLDHGPRRSMRCWLPHGTGPLNGVTEGVWAAACVDSFESAAARFGRTQQEVDT